MKRTKHSLSHYKLATLDMGKLVPVAVVEVLPGDTVQMASSALIRVSPLMAPVMHPVSVRIHHWYVPNRIIWDGWEDFITGGPDGIGGDSGAYPTIQANGIAKDLGDYFGLPVGVSKAVSALPFRAYAKIFNEHYRDQDLVPELPETTASGVDAVTLQSVQNIAWEKDQFTAARPWSQKGPDVSLPLGVTAPVNSNDVPPFWRNTQGIDHTFNSAANNVQIAQSAPADTAGGDWRFGSRTGLVADLSNATAANVNDIRRAFALQRYQEARAMYGSRFTEYLRYLGIRSSDARLQRPEYLGGGKQTISFSEVLRTGAESTAPIGEMAGHGIAAMRSRRFRRFIEEHGHIISLMSVRPRTMYVQGVERMWSRRVKEDYWQRELENIGQEEVYRGEVFSDGTANDDILFGFNDRYYSYRHVRSSVAGDFRTTLNFWHMARDFATAPVLNQDFVECDPSKRIHAVQTEDVLWCMISNSIQARRMVRRPGIGRIM